MIKRILLAGAAGLATVSLAQAADLPMEKAEAVEYVKVCTEFGTGFFYIPGTDTCLKLSGHVRANYQVFEKDDFNNDSKRSDFSHNFRLNVDARTATEFGTLRSFAELNFNSDKSTAGGIVGKAYLQLGGLTAGYAASVYNFYDTNYADTVFASYYAPQATVNQLSYTATFGGGFYASLSIEESRRTKIRGVTQPFSALGVASGPATAVLDTSVFGSPVRDLYGGHEIPDLVGAIGVSQSWGKAQVMAAAHQVRYNEFSAAGAAAVAGPPAIAAIPGVGDDEWGYAVGGGLAVNLPIAAGGWVVVEANYADGAVSYLGYDGPDAVVGALTGTGPTGWTTDNSKGWSVVGELAVQATPSLLLVAFGSYIDVDWGSPSGLAVTNGLTYSSSALFKNEKSYIVGANVQYTLTKGLKIAAEIDYTSKDIEKAVDTDSTAAVVAGTASDDTGSWEGGLRIERSF